MTPHAVFNTGYRQRLTVQTRKPTRLRPPFLAKMYVKSVPSSLLTPMPPGLRSSNTLLPIDEHQNQIFKRNSLTFKT